MESSSGCPTFVVMMHAAHFRNFYHPHVIQTLAAKRAHDSFHIRTLPGRVRRGKNLLTIHGFHLLDEALPKDAIPIAQ
jgi:hypothetical protein